MKKKLIVNGMYCEACSALITKTLKETENVNSVSVNFLTKEVEVDFNCPYDVIEKKITSLGYKVKKALNTRNYVLLFSVILLVILFYISNAAMFNFPIFKFMKGFYPNSLAQLLLATIIILLNFKFYKSGFKGLIKKAPNMDTLIMIGSFSGYVFGILLIILKLFNYNFDNNINHLYFESSCMIIVFVSIGKYIESRAIDKTTKSIKDLISYLPTKAIKLVDNKEVEIEIEHIKENDIILSKNGSIIPVDGEVIKNNSLVDESLLTGEPGFVLKKEKDLVYKATVIKEGYLIIKATTDGLNSMYDEVIKLVNDSQSNKANIGKLADKICRYFVPTIMILSLITFIIWIFIKNDFIFSFNLAITVLVVSCPCALGLATPVSITAATGVAFKNYSYVKRASIFEELAKIKYVLCDKTGTVTYGNMQINSINPYNIEKDEFLSLVVSLERYSNHPLSKEISKIEVQIKEVKDFETIPTKGIKGLIENKELVSGDINYFEELGIEIKNNNIDQTFKNIYFAYGNKYIGFISFHDLIKESSKEAIEGFLKLGITPVLISGDTVKKTEEVSLALGFKDYYGEVFPKGKNDILKTYKEKGPLLFIGDGINDSIAITQASVSMAIGTGADIALENADVILKRSNLMDALNTVKLSMKTLKIIKQNLFFAFIYNILLIPISMGALWMFDIYMKPSYGAIAMCLSSLCVVFNALRINLFKYGKEKDNVN